MKIDSKEAKDLLAQVAGLKTGGKLEFQGALLGFDAPVTAHCTEVIPDKFWQFALYWNAVFLQDVVIERHVDGKQLVVDILGA